MPPFHDGADEGGGRLGALMGWREQDRGDRHCLFVPGKQLDVAGRFRPGGISARQGPRSWL
eukprot:269670-Lingulodinium_polyedra.AAC.1